MFYQHPVDVITIDAPTIVVNIFFKKSLNFYVIYMIILNIFHQELSSWRFLCLEKIMPKFVDCQITYKVELETKNLQEESKKVREELKRIEQ